MSDIIIVGSEHHRYVGSGVTCSGVIGNKNGERCNKLETASIHDLPPGWDSWTSGPAKLTDSGSREQYSNGMVRELDSTKPRFDLLLPVGVEYNHQMLTRFATHMGKGAVKYSDRNWEKGVGLRELERAKESALRHMMQWFAGENDEDHAAAVYFNIMQAEYIKYMMGKNE